MKHSTFVLLACLSTLAKGQTFLNAYYVVPPTSGCDGLAAFGPASTIWQAPCSAPYTYVAEPDGCAQGPGPGGAVLWFGGDTVYTNLCSIPCNVTIYDSSGECVTLCEIPVNTAVAAQLSASVSELRLDPNPLAAGTPLRISTTGQAPVELTLIDAQGRLVDRSLLSSQSGTIGTTSLGVGLHVLRAHWKDGRVSIYRLVVQ